MKIHTFNTGLCNRFRKDVHAGTVGLERYQDMGRLDVVLLSNPLNNIVLEERGVVGSKGRVSGDGNAL
jgi:hypothetical protein